MNKKICSMRDQKNEKHIQDDFYQKWKTREKLWCKHFQMKNQKGKITSIHKQVSLIQSFRHFMWQKLWRKKRGEMEHAIILIYVFMCN